MLHLADYTCVQSTVACSMLRERTRKVLVRVEQILILQAELYPAWRVSSVFMAFRDSGHIYMLIANL